VRRHRSDELREVLSDWPGGEPADWLRYVNDPMTAKELKRLKLSEERGRPYGDEAWAMQQVDKLGLQHTVRKEGRPKKLVE
jgi:putative transposase